jgi:hypothetical protein
MHFDKEMKSEDFVEYLEKHYRQDKSDAAEKGKSELIKLLRSIKLKACAHQCWFIKEQGVKKYKELKVLGDTNPLSFIQKELARVSNINTLFHLGMEMMSIRQFHFFVEHLDVDILSPNEHKWNSTREETNKDPDHLFVKKSLLLH